MFQTNWMVFKNPKGEGFLKTRLLGALPYHMNAKSFHLKANKNRGWQQNRRIPLKDVALSTRAREEKRPLTFMGSSLCVRWHRWLLFDFDWSATRRSEAFWRNRNRKFANAIPLFLPSCFFFQIKRWTRRSIGDNMGSVRTNDLLSRFPRAISQCIQSEGTQMDLPPSPWTYLVLTQFQGTTVLCWGTLDIVQRSKSDAWNRPERPWRWPSDLDIRLWYLSNQFIIFCASYLRGGHANKLERVLQNLEDDPVRTFTEL